MGDFTACLDAELLNLRSRLLSAYHSSSVHGGGQLSGGSAEHSVLAEVDAARPGIFQIGFDSADIEPVQPNIPRSDEKCFAALPDELGLEVLDTDDESEGEDEREDPEALDNWTRFVFNMGFGDSSAYVPPSHKFRFHVRSTWIQRLTSFRTSAAAYCTRHISWKHAAKDPVDVIVAGDVLRDRTCPMLQKIAIHPYGPTKMMWGLLSIILVLWDVIFIPLRVFDLYGFGEVLDNLATWTLPIWLLDMVFCFVVGNDVNGYIDMRPSANARRYLKNWFVVDANVLLIDALVLLGAFDGIDTDTVGMTRLARILRVARLARLLRLGKLMTFLSVLLDQGQSATLLIACRLLLLMLLTVIVNHYIACGWYGVAAFSGEPLTWTQMPEFQDLPVWKLYVASLHWALTQFSPATNNICPTNASERSFAVGVVIFALGLLTSLASSIASHSTQIRSLHERRNRDDASLRTFFTSRRLSSDICCRIKLFSKSVSNKYKHFQHEASVPLLKLMPKTLQIRLHAELYMPGFLASGLFRQLYETDEFLLVRACHEVFKEKSVPPKSDVFVENTQCDHAIFTVLGKLTYILQDRHGWSATARNRRITIDDHSKGRKRHFPSIVLKEDVCTVPIESGVWLAELAVWSEWNHCGLLVSQSAADMILLDCEIFCKLVNRQGGPSVAYFRGSLSLLSPIWSRWKRLEQRPQI
eukprot:TRINITY_DN5999_c0_g1_i2.p1 TRINITY_DN5999_c0_g1~~TRINITY_DN5999_c0_g1_i2.p1  ORF type:complete len:698 (-),score=69.80 TRINITY_DN5999_c0_g1_i2:96-2189(-)